mmetsp:Transcript_1819/g.4553  ORF Transcript_1819/g.4553 Transcript_1819/m.4553 type:complete len:447 (-) Transcript_1819:1914-3254(-)
MRFFLIAPNWLSFIPSCGLFLFLLDLTPSLSSDAASSMMMPQRPPGFIHADAATAKPSITIKTSGSERPAVSVSGNGNKNIGETADDSPKIKHKRRTRPPRRRATQQLSRNPKQRQKFSRAKTGLSNICPPLDGPIGAPQLPVLTTKDPCIIERWLENHAHVGSDASPNEYSYTILGFDQESIAKPPWKPERASLPDGPATIQLSTPSSCIIIQLSRCGDGSSLHAPDILRRIINDPRIIKVGVGIDDDALELYRWSKESFEGAHEGSSLGKNQQQIPQLWEMTSRFDLGCILPDKKPSLRSGIRELAQKILGVEVEKSKKLSMSNWGKRHLTLEQISYAARDAWVPAAIVERLQKDNIGVFRAEALMDMEFMKHQRSMDIMDERATSRKAAKLELKEMLARQKDDVEQTGYEDEERKQHLHHLLDLYRPDQPPTFDENAFTLPIF